MSGAPFDAAIVGFGPVGATLANLLGQRGLRVVVFEATTSVYHLPRAAHFDGEVMRVFQSIGLADAVRPCTAPIAGMHFVDADGRKLFGYDAPQGRGPHGWADNFMFSQPDLEAVLRSGVGRYGGVDVRLGHEVTRIEPVDDAVEISFTEVETGDADRVLTQYALGCDGARSATRLAAGIELEDLGFDQPWLVVDTVLRRPVDLPAVSIQHCDPSRPVTYVPGAAQRRRWEFMLLPGETPEEMERPARVAELLAPWVGPDDAEVVRAVVYSFHALIAEPWRAGRLLVVGDAAHQMPPFLGQGMCAGIRDAQNLAWKLDLVRRGRASDRLLDTYETERAPHVRTIIETAVNTGRIIQTTDPAVAAARDAHFLDGDGAPDAGGGVRMPGLTGGCLAGAGAPVGELLAQPELSLDGAPVLLDDLCGQGFAVLGRSDPRTAMTAKSAALWDELESRFVASTALGPWLDDAGAEFVILRPDRYVFGVARDPGDLDAVTDSLRSHLDA